LRNPNTCANTEIGTSKIPQIDTNFFGCYCVVAPKHKRDFAKEIKMKRYFKTLAVFVLLITIAMSGSSFAASSVPVFSTLPGSDAVINLADGETISVNPFTIMVRPTCDAGIDRVEFFVTTVGVAQHFICSTPDENGVYSFLWDTSQNQSVPPYPPGTAGIPEHNPDVMVIAYSKSGETVEISRTVSVILTIPYTGR
jgi:hypothetical protein